MSLKALVKAAVAKTPYRVTRGAPNRFDAIEGSLKHLRAVGYNPRVVIDGGAHVGHFSIMAGLIFPQAEFHMVEPQPACRSPLEQIARQRGFHFHAYALGADAGTLRLWAG